MQNKQWEAVKVGDLISSRVLLINDGYRVTNRELGPIGIPFVRGGDIGDGRITTEVDDHILAEFQDRVESKLTKAHDVAFISKGTVGRVGILRPDQPPVVFAPQVCYWRVLDRRRLHPGFLFYLIKGNEFQRNLDAVKTHGSMVADYVSMSDQRNFKLTIPPIDDQTAIANALGSLDDKIELNRRMNETLEAIARAIFRSWFVDFDPVRAKMDGRRPYGMDAEAASIFPDSFEDSPLGEIPRGWRVKQLDKVCQFNQRQIRGSSEFDTIEYVDISSVMRGRLLETQRLRFEEAPSRARRLVAHGDTIFSTVRPGRGAFLYITDPQPELVVSTGFVVMTPHKVTSLYLHKWVTTDDFIDYMDRNADGAAYPAIRPERIGEGLILVPPQPLMKNFEDRCQACYAKIRSNDLEDRTLAALRDALLPKLLSGEIRVKDAEALARDAG